MATRSVLTTPFGEVSLASADAAPIDEADRSAALSDRLPPGMRLDGGLLGRLKIGFGTGGPTTLELSCDLADGCEASPSNGERLAAWTVEGPGLSGAFAIRDLDGLAQAHGLENTFYANAKAGLTARFRAAAPGVRTFEFAAAWTLNPSDDADEMAPWLAVDRILSLRT
ncbi:MAG: hypothetical protein AAF192_05055 [Pseudomonadota bacterium]